MSDLHVRERHLAGNNGGHAMYILPGWLGWSKDQHQPLLPVLARDSTVMGLDYFGPVFNPTNVIHEVAHTVRSAVKNNWLVHLFGTSLGGIVAAMAVATMPPELSKHVSITMVDSPSGADSLKQLPKLAAPAVVRTMKNPPAWMDSRPGNAVFKRVFCGGMPVTASIEIPEGFDPAMYRTDVLQAAWRGQQGFSPRLAFSELAFMASLGGGDGPLAQACKQLRNNGVDRRITYIACMGDNQVVRQPLAMRDYADWLPNMMAVSAYTADHADYAQSAVTWRRLLEREVPIV